MGKSLVILIGFFVACQSYTYLYPYHPYYQPLLVPVIPRVNMIDAEVPVEAVIVDENCHNVECPEDAHFVLLPKSGCTKYCDCRRGSSVRI